MKLYDYSCDGSNLIGMISYYNLFWDWPLINHLLPDLPNLFGLPFKSTF